MNKQEWRTHIAMRQRMGLDVGAAWFRRLPNDQKWELWDTVGRDWYPDPPSANLLSRRWRDVWRDLSGLHPTLRHYEGQRVEVKWDDGTIERFQVGRSSGWRPCTLMLHNRASRGGTPAWLMNCDVLRIIPERNRRER